MKKHLFYLFIASFFCLANKELYGQELLDKKMSIQIYKQPLSQALRALAREGDFYFSYNSRIIPKDSLVTLKSTDKTLKNILIHLLGIRYIYKQQGNYVIIQQYKGNEETYFISGHVINAKDGKGIPNVSVYAKKQLVTVLTDSEGYFKLKLHDYSAYILLGASKVNYSTRTITLNSGKKLYLKVQLSPIQKVTLNPVTVYSYKNWISKLLLSSKQKIRDINLSDFFVNQKFQFSVWPTVGSHGKMSGQIKNNWTFNILGGYSAGVKWFELGGLFNIDKKDVGTFQMAGIFNAVEGKATGFQGAGIYNVVGDSLTGFQIAGIYNKVDGAVSGVQMAGILNKTKDVRGWQFAGAINLNKDTITGLQMAGIFNKTKVLKGWQVGLINISDTSNGYSLGLVNMVKKNSFYKLDLSYNETMEGNIAFKSGSPKLYNIISLNIGNLKDHPYWGFGYGLGHLFNYDRKVTYSLELAGQFIVGGFKYDTPVLSNIRSSIHIPLSHKIGLYAGPSFNVLFQGSALPKYSNMRLRPKHYFTLSDNIFSWFGFQVGISFF